jgi:uncharacterized protein
MKIAAPMIALPRFSVWGAHRLDLAFKGQGSGTFDPPAIREAQMSQAVVRGYDADDSAAETAEGGALVSRVFSPARNLRLQLVIGQ